VQAACCAAALLVGGPAHFKFAPSFALLLHFFYIHPPAERAAIQAELDALAAEQPEAVKQGFVEPLLRGVASHHAGCLPAWKGLVERLFQRGEIQC
jgi:superfamily II RNA helicase